MNNIKIKFIVMKVKYFTKRKFKIRFKEVDLNVVMITTAYIERNLNELSLMHALRKNRDKTV